MLADPVGLQHPALIVLLAELATLFSAERDELQDEENPRCRHAFPGLAGHQRGDHRVRRPIARVSCRYLSASSGLLAQDTVRPHVF
jgi:hypothetical protein